MLGRGCPEVFWAASAQREKNEKKSNVLCMLYICYVCMYACMWVCNIYVYIYLYRYIYIYIAKPMYLNPIAAHADGARRERGSGPSFSAAAASAGSPPAAAAPAPAAADAPPAAAAGLA
jgi:hypothetical protein